MRLTLRTLLAWLDDTLPPGEVRQIGQQVAETPLAQELVDRIHRVTRQRRLTVPSDSGPDGTDPATVASYIDDGLEPDEIVEFEKKCLTSDVHLAEVASVHQILSLLAQKAKVPPEARERMYHLIKGREAVGSTVPRTFKPPKPVKEPSSVSSWSPEPLPKASWFERFGPASGIAALCLLLLWSAYMSLGGGTKAPGKDNEIAKPNPRQVAPIVQVKEKADEAARLNALENAAAKEEEAAKKAAMKAEAQPIEQPPAPPADLVALAAGTAGVVGDKMDGILLRFNVDAPGKWDKLAPSAPLKDGDRIVNLSPFLTPMQVGAAKVMMVGDGEMVVLSTVAGTSSRFELKRGRLRIVGGNPDPIAVPFDAGVLKLTLSPGTVIGLERINYRAQGDKLPSAPALQISVAEGEVTAEAGTAKETISAGSTILFHAPDQFSNKAPATVPSWATEIVQNDAQKERGRLFAAYFKPDRQAKACIAEAASDEHPEVRDDAINAYGALDGELLDLLVTTMRTQNEPAARKAAIATLRDYAKRDAESAKMLRSSLVQNGGSKRLGGYRGDAPDWLRESASEPGSDDRETARASQARGRWHPRARARHAPESLGPEGPTRLRSG